MRCICRHAFAVCGVCPSPNKISEQQGYFRYVPRGNMVPCDYPHGVCIMNDNERHQCESKLVQLQRQCNTCGGSLGAAAIPARTLHSHLHLCVTANAACSTRGMGSHRYAE